MNSVYLKRLKEQRVLPLQQRRQPQVAQGVNLGYHPGGEGEGAYIGPRPRSLGLAVAGQDAGQALVEAAVTDHASLLDVRKVVGSLAVSSAGGGVGQRESGQSLGQHGHVELAVVRGRWGLRHFIVCWNDG